ncbi:zinc-dependent alcohol dehydrogenase family protein [Micromonospora sp. NBC_01699]|uniref:zinc-dependent alcohol dehydrogenase family protein n=1 Tax=Micromonospora sp. NBC_01699 TaxID=2975984 RepID=UPI002E3660F3|nr:zinc-dependent alcohol dehydrogenase family protein [Micromonospora sp. NBC_01699]
MRAVVFDEFGGRPEVRTVADPSPPVDGVVVRVEATGLCRSDWHGWQGHDPDIRLPHVPGHEFAGVVAEVGAGVSGVRVGDRVTAPFVYGCGRCAECLAGQQQVCAFQTQPGFTQWGSYAEYVVVDNAAVNLVALPDEVDYRVAAALGCRFATAFRAVVTQGRVAAGEWVAVFGCGGVGLSAVMVAAASGARVVAVDLAEPALALARECGATATVNVAGLAGPVEVATAVRDLTGGGAHLSVDALGSHDTCVAGIRSLRRRGRHIQVGLLPAVLGAPALPMDLVIGAELEVRGSHGMAAHAYPALLGLITGGVLDPSRLVTGAIGLDAAPAALTTMDRPGTAGIRLIEPGARA